MIGMPVRVKNHNDGTEKTDALELFLYLNKIGHLRDPRRDNLLTAHLDIDDFTMNREHRKIKRELDVKFGDQVYRGFSFSPECDFTRWCINRSQELVEGTVTVKLYKGSVNVVGRKSPLSLYSEELVSMNVQGDYDPVDANGFIRVNALRYGIKNN
ncbi:hypothetical protein CHS0354_015512 [Potamilus streckersoni]|uniref:argininosuccinate synthase n=1 Tax=Potamilus streckersoni TaxID=2493646 RepID=A0AAE0VUJ0_9BIVA|nr:hypothetical protein CHS0354_015512 [Potamilus streckersoni]